MRKITLISLLVLFTFVVSCSKYDFNDVNINYDGEWAVPIISSRLDFGDLSNTDSDVMHYDEDGFIRLIYRGNNIGSYYLGDILKIPPQQSSTRLDFSIPPIPFDPGVDIPLLKIPITIPFQLDENMMDARLDKVVLKEGILRINPLFAEEPHGISVKSMTITIDNLIGVNGSPAVLVVVPGRDNYIDMNGCTLKMPTNELNINIDMQLNKPYTYPYMGQDCSLLFYFEMNDIKYKEIRGYLGNIQATYADTIYIHLFDKSVGGNITIPMFKAELNIKSSIGASLGIYEQCFKAVARGNKPDMVITGLPQSVVIKKPAVEHGFSDVTVTLQSQSLSKAISDMYEKFAFEYMIKLNPEHTEENYVFDDSMIDMEVDFEIPLSGSLESVVFADTMRLDIPEVEMLNKLVVNTNMTNNFPLGVKFQIYFLDENHKPIKYPNGTVATLFPLIEPLIVPAAVGSDGKVIAPSNKITTIEISSEAVQTLKNTMYISLVAIIDSEGYNGNKQIKLYNTGYFDVKIGMKVKADISVNSNDNY